MLDVNLDEFRDQGSRGRVFSMPLDRMDVPFWGCDSSAEEASERQ